MAATHDTVNTALSLIDAITLPHPAGALLASFVKDALNPNLAAQYVTNRLSSGVAESLVHDWIYIILSIRDGGAPPAPDTTSRRAIRRRDGGRCCVTGKAGTFWDPLIETSILPVPHGWTADQPSVFNMLGAFFGAPYRDWWIAYASSPESMSPFRSHWLIRQSAARVFAKGHVRLNRLQPSMIEYELDWTAIGLEKPINVDGCFPLLGDHSRSGLEKVDPRFVGTQARLSKSIQYMTIARNIAPDLLRPFPDTSVDPPNPNSVPEHQTTTWRLFSTLTKGVFGVFLSAWLMFPSRIRVGGYVMLRKLGRLLYGQPAFLSTVQRLPFGLYLKYHGELDGFRNEFNACRLVHRHTSIPAPEALDVVSKKKTSDAQFPSYENYLLTTRVPGIPLALCHELVSDGDLGRIAEQMKEYVSQLRKIPASANPDMSICNTLGEACRDTRIRGAQPVGPFLDEEAFSRVLRFPDHPGRRGHTVVFTHADLNPRNILVDRVARPDGTVGWSVTGIVDWENSGYYPEYWECTKAMFEGFRWSTRYNNMVKAVFKEFGGYEKELDVERKSWESGDAV